MTDLSLVTACEQRIVNAWPSVTTLYAEGCVLRFAHGYSGRANALSALRPGTVLTPALLDWAEALYRAEGLPPCVRVTPLLAEGTRTMLEACGYRVRDRSVGMIGPASGGRDPRFRHAPKASAAWVRGVSRLQSGAKKDADDALMAIVSRVKPDAAFATIEIEGKPAAFGMSVAERGFAEIGAIIVDDDWRGQGIGRALVTSLMGWAAEAGAQHCYLQVEGGNAIAFQLYGSLGFTRLYDYQTMVRD